jgi:dehydrogenase/reductase SDR family member 12
MHPGWAETPGVHRSIPDFEASHRDDLRTAAQGADTIVWLATSDAVATGGGGGGPQTGKFWFDRAAVSPDFPWAGTAAPEPDWERLWRLAEGVTGWKWAT